MRASATAWLGGTCKGSYLVENLSLGGIYLSGGPAIRPGTPLTLRLQLPVEAVEVTGAVTRSDRLAPGESVVVYADRKRFPERAVTASIAPQPSPAPSLSELGFGNMVPSREGSRSEPVGN